VPGPDPVWESLNKPRERTRLDTNVETSPPMSSNCGLLYFGTKGFFDTYYARPYDPVTRSEAVRWLHKYMKLEGFDAFADVSGTKPIFADVHPSHPDFEYVQQMGILGILDPWNNSEGFCPCTAVSRKEAVSWIVLVKMLISGRKLDKTSCSLIWEDVHEKRTEALYFDILNRKGMLPKR